MASKKAKAGSKKKAAKKKEASAAENATLLAIEAAADAIDCNRCVIATIQSHCGSTIGDLSDKLRDLCSPCDSGVMADLAGDLRENCGAPQDLRLRCSMSVLQVIDLVCRS